MLTQSLLTADWITIFSNVDPGLKPAGPILAATTAAAAEQNVPNFTREKISWNYHKVMKSSTQKS